jgi:hypothetical protein
MPRKPSPPPDDPEQSKRFIEIAREVGAEGTTREEFDSTFRKVASRPPQRPKPSRSKTD